MPNSEVSIQKTEDRIHNPKLRTSNPKLRASNDERCTGLPDHSFGARPSLTPWWETRLTNREPGTPNPKLRTAKRRTVIRNVESVCLGIKFRRGRAKWFV